MLTLMSIAETQTEISFDKLCREMKLNEDDVERFILEGKETYKPVGIYENGVYFCLTYIFICQTSGLLPSLKGWLYHQVNLGNEYYIMC